VLKYVTNVALNVINTLSGTVRNVPKHAKNVLLNAGKWQQRKLFA
jgi:hypothetical protein